MRFEVGGPLIEGIEQVASHSHQFADLGTEFGRYLGAIEPIKNVANGQNNIS